MYQRNEFFFALGITEEIVVLPTSFVFFLNRQSHENTLEQSWLEFIKNVRYIILPLSSKNSAHWFVAVIDPGLARIDIVNSNPRLHAFVSLYLILLLSATAVCKYFRARRWPNTFTIDSLVHVGDAYESIIDSPIFIIGNVLNYFYYFNVRCFKGLNCRHSRRSA